MGRSRGVFTSPPHEVRIIADVGRPAQSAVVDTTAPALSECASISGLLESLESLAALFAESSSLRGVPAGVFVRSNWLRGL